MEDPVEAIKKIVKEELTDEEAKDLLLKMERNRQAELIGRPYVMFDWAKAIMLIFAHDVKNAEFGLKEDWEDSKAIGLLNRKPIPPTKESKFGYCLVSNWATPVLYDINNEKCYECWKEVPSGKLAQIGNGLWWPEDVKMSFDFVAEIMEDLQ